MNDEPRQPGRKLIWWGRGDPAYSRNAVIRSAMLAQGWSIHDYRPSKAVSYRILSPKHLPTDAALVWVACFRQRDLLGAARYARRHNIPLIFDPLISAYDKQVFEKQKFIEGSYGAQRLLRWERNRLRLADCVVADTQSHADFFVDTLGVSPEKTAVIPVGAEAEHFHPTPMNPFADRRVRVLFYGSFISLQGPEVIVQAARRCPEVDWCLLGDGPLREKCEVQAAGLTHVSFEPWIDYADLPARIAKADLLLGVFSDSAKAGRVVPNKVYQAMACGRPVVTRTPAPGTYPWPEAQSPAQTGLIFIPPSDPDALAQTVKRLSQSPDQLPQRGQSAAAMFDQYCSASVINNALHDTLSKVLATPKRASI